MSPTDADRATDLVSENDPALNPVLLNMTLGGLLRHASRR